MTKIHEDQNSDIGIDDAIDVEEPKNIRFYFTMMTTRQWSL